MKKVPIIVEGTDGSSAPIVHEVYWVTNKAIRSLQRIGFIIVADYLAHRKLDGEWMLKKVIGPRPRPQPRLK